MTKRKLKKYRIDCEMTVQGYRIIEAWDEDDAREQAESFYSGIACSEFYDSCEVESMPDIRVIWVTEEKPKRKTKGRK